MRIHHGLHGSPIATDGCVATIGNFDGLHLGHQTLIQRLADMGRQSELPVCIVLFEPQPREFFEGDAAPARLSRLGDKLLLLQQMPVDHVLVLRFDHTLADLDAASFIEQVLVHRLHVNHLVIGDDFRFGRGREGNFALLRADGRFSVSDTPPLHFEGERISSTRLRAALEQGNLELARKLMGRDYTMHGKVVSGARLGRRLGFPTANIRLMRKNLPLTGVFAVTMRTHHGLRLHGVANIGIRPSLAGQPEALLEVHAFDFSGNLYGSRVAVALQHKLREEQRFPDLESLRQQITRDAAQARHYFTTAKQ